MSQTTTNAMCEFPLHHATLLGRINSISVRMVQESSRGHLGCPWSVRSAQGRTGIAAADFSRIRNADLGRFTVDRLMSIINRLGSRVEVKIKVRRAETVER
jgi:hypothetical protein